MESFYLSHIPPMQYNSILSEIPKHMSFLSIVRSSLNIVHLWRIILSLYWEKTRLPTTYTYI